jgi:hypothetical protein
MNPLNTFGHLSGYSRTMAWFLYDKEQRRQAWHFPPYGLFLERSQKAGQMGRLVITEFLNLPQFPFFKVGALKEMSLSSPLGKGEGEI